MKSRIVGRLRFDADRVKEDVDRILAYPSTSTYAGYSFGTWKTYVLWNASGDSNDSTIREFSGSGRFTDLGLRADYITSMILDNFDTERMKWARMFLLENGNIIPHRDYLEFGKSLTRVHIALFADESSMHSEEDEVFRMRNGEVWYLAATQVHAAVTMSDFPRTVVCLEFDLEDWERPEVVLKEKTGSLPDPPFIVEREKLTSTELQAIFGLGDIVNNQNYNDIVRLLSKIHFYKSVSACSMFQWMGEIARRSGKKDIIERVIDLKRNCIECRRIGEHVNLS